MNVTVERSLRTLEAGRLAALSPYFPVALALAGIALLLYGAGSGTVVQDTWSTLVAGREVAHSGLPSVDHLTVLGAGHRWTDQQWLAQLALYGAELVGGLKAAVLVGAAAALLAYAIVLRSAQRQPGSPALLTGAAMLAIASSPWACQVRAQELALPLGAGVLALLLSDPAATRRRTLLVLPLLCLWANVHGSVVLGAGIVCLYGLTLFVPGGINRRTARRAAPFLLLSPLTVFVSPYGFDLVAYYRLLLVDPPFKHLIQEWEPPRPGWYTLPLFVLAGLTVVSLLLRFRRLPVFETALLLATLALALNALHNTVWFALAALAVLPSRVLRSTRAYRTTVGGLFAAAAIVGLVVVCGVAVAAPRSHYMPLRHAAGHAVASALARVGGNVYADDAHADWVLWTVPRARGRVLYDSRIELIRRADIERISRLQSVSGNYGRTLEGVNVIVAEPAIARSFERVHWGRVVYSDSRTVVFVRR